MKTAVAGVLILLLWGSVSSCRTAPIHDVLEAPLPTAQGAAITDDLDEAIWRAGRKVGWKIERIRPGVLRGTWRFKHHLAVVSITHDQRYFTIRYVDSQNLLYDGDQIHRRYNSLVEELARQIEQEPVTPTGFAF